MPPAAGRGSTISISGRLNNKQFRDSAMKYKSSIRINALSLLTIFALNMVIGFLCSLGIDMGYNSNHHQGIEPEQVSGSFVPACHMAVSDSGSSNNQSSNSNDCCSGGVVKFLKLDKTTSPTITVDLEKVPVILATYHVNYQPELLQYLGNTSRITHVLMRRDHRPQRDILTTIQSFLI